MSNAYKKLELMIAKNKYNSYTHPSYELECELMIYIKQMDIEEGLKILNKINSLERAQLSKLPLTSLKYSLVGSCTLFTRAVIEAGLDYETAFMLSDYYINLIDDANNKDRIEELEYSMLMDFIDVLKTHKEYIYSPAVNHVISYIKKNIEKRLSLKELASYVNLHPNYLSTVFKESVGRTITEYINEQRIEAIKLYLEHTNLSISEISYIFNFKHLSYFTNYFKSYTGLTPMEYKNHKFIE